MKKPLQIDVIYDLISKNKGIARNKIHEITNYPEKSIDRWTRKLWFAGKITFSGIGWKVQYKKN